MEVRQLFRAKSPLVDRREVRDSNTLILGLVERFPAEAAIAIVTDSSVKLSDWTHLTFAYDGSSKSSGIRVYLNGKAVEVRTNDYTLTASMRGCEFGPDLRVEKRVAKEFFQLIDHEHQSHGAAVLLRRAIKRRADCEIYGKRRRLAKAFGELLDSRNLRRAAPGAQVPPQVEHRGRRADRRRVRRE